MDFDKAYNYRGVGEFLLKFNSNKYRNKKGEPSRNLEKEWNEIVSTYDIPYLKKFPTVLDFIGKTEKYFHKRGKDIIRRVDKMRYVRNNNN
jgi:hypothetical protein